MKKLLALSACTLLAAPVLADVHVGVIASLTGPAAALGAETKKAVALLPTTVGKEKVQYIVLDDASDPTNAVTNVKKLISDQKVDALIGPTTTPAALAMLDFVAESKTPLVTTVGSSAIIQPMDDKKKWVFKTTQNDDLIAGALIEHMTAHGVKTLGFIGFNDPYGENWFKVFGAMAEKAGLKLLVSERFNRTDQSVTGQALKVIAAKPDAVLVAATGGPAVLPQTTLQEKGYVYPCYMSMEELDALLEPGVIAGEILDHEVEGLAQLPELVGIPRRDAYAEVAAAYAVRRIEEIRQGLDEMRLELKDGAGADNQQQDQRDALDEAQPLQLGLQPLFDERHQAVDAGHHLGGVGAQRDAVLRRAYRAAGGRPEAPAPPGADVIVGRAHGVAGLAGDGTLQLGVTVAGFELGEGLLHGLEVARVIAAADDGVDQV